MSYMKIICACIVNHYMQNCTCLAEKEKKIRKRSRRKKRNLKKPKRI